MAVGLAAQVLGLDDPHDKVCLRCYLRPHSGRGRRHNGPGQEGCTGKGRRDECIGVLCTGAGWSCVMMPRPV